MPRWLVLLAAVAALACGEIDKFDPPYSPIETWLSEHRGGFCNDRYNRLINLCGDVEFCMEPAIMRLYPLGLSVDLGFHWDGAAGSVLDMGGDCEGKRLAFYIEADGVLLGGALQGAPSLEGRIEPGTHLLSYRIDSEASSLFLDGELVDAGIGTSTTPELLGECGPGVILGQRLSYWWEPEKQERWLRFAPFFFHLRDAGHDALFDLSEATSPGADTVLLFEPSGAEGSEWSPSIGVQAGVALDGASYEDDAFSTCLSANRPPESPVVGVDPALPEEGASLECLVIQPSIDRDGDSVSYSFRWQRDGVESVHTEARLPAGVTRTGQAWACIVTPHDDLASGSEGSASVLVTGREPCRGITLTSTSARIAVSNPGYELGGGAWTVEFWLRVHDQFPIANTNTAPVLTMNEDYAVHSIRPYYDPVQGVIACDVYGSSASSGSLIARSAPIRDGRWHHVACAHADGEMTVFTDGNPGATDRDLPDIRALSPMAIGRPSGYPETAAPPIVLGPLRISRTARYVGRFDPGQDWIVDAPTISQHLVRTGLEDGQLIDEAGDDNTGRDAIDIEFFESTRCR